MCQRGGIGELYHEGETEVQSSEIPNRSLQTLLIPHGNTKTPSPRMPSRARLPHDHGAPELHPSVLLSPLRPSHLALRFT